jgi:Zn-dependent alcohol dehydrogenase
MTDGGADYSFECVGDTGIVSTALQSCSDVIFLLIYFCIHLTDH